MKKILYPMIFLILGGCGSPRKETPFDLVAYKNEIEAWHSKRVDELKGPKGWLNVAGLYWLHDGINTFGSGDQNDLVFPKGKISDRAGFFMLKQNVVTIEAAPGTLITSNAKPIQVATVFHPDSSRGVVLDHGTLQWFIIKRDTKLGVRLRDFESEELIKFNGIERYPVDVAWRIEAEFEKGDSTRTIDITNVLGQTTPQRSPGTLNFEVQGQSFQIDVLEEGGDEYFVIFGDQTNAKETYGAGRFLYVRKPGADGKTIIDFNKAYNPPCAFTAFATCPLPPKQNFLNVSVTAGEKNYAGHPVPVSLEIK